MSLLFRSSLFASVLVVVEVDITLALGGRGSPAPYNIAKINHNKLIYLRTFYVKDPENLDNKKFAVLISYKMLIHTKA